MYVKTGEENDIIEQETIIMVAVGFPQIHIFDFSFIDPLSIGKIQVLNVNKQKQPYRTRRP